MTTIFPDSGGPDGVPEYRYQPLVAADAVRVLVVHPADSLDEPLHCSIVQYILSTELYSDNYCNDRHYSAVSYRWGPGLFPCQLFIDKPLVRGTSGAASAYLKITANVDSLLRHLRKAHKAVSLWTDSVCLNQNDEEEKAQQIPRMGDIYRAAKKVHIWLGNDNIDDARRAFSIIREVELRNKWDPSQDEISLLTKFFKREWFSRRWIIQEAVLAHDARLHCGPYSLSLSWVLLALKKAQYSATGLDALGYGAEMLLSSIGEYQEAPGSSSLLTLLWDLHLSECADPRDRVAALYGLASESERPSDLRGYSEGATQLYLDCAAYFVNRDAMSAHALILHLAEFGSLPEDSQRWEPLSWVPDWWKNRQSPLPNFHDESQNILVALYDSLRAQVGLRTSMPIYHLPENHPGKNSVLVNYFKEFKHATQMSAQSNVLRIHSNPLVFPTLGGIVEKVYCCKSSSWKDVWSLFRRMTRELGGFTTGEEQLLKMLLSAVHKDRLAKEVRLSDFEALVNSSQHSPGPSRKDIEFLEEIGSILSIYSLIRINKSLSTGSVNSILRHSSVYHLGPRNAAVDDFLVPFMIPEHEGNRLRNEACWSVSMCLRPTLTTGMETSGDKCHPFSPFCRTMRWVGLTFNNQCYHLSDLLSRTETYRLGYGAYWKAMDDGLPGPYVFDVI